MEWKIDSIRPRNHITVPFLLPDQQKPFKHRRGIRTQAAFPVRSMHAVFPSTVRLDVIGVALSECLHLGVLLVDNQASSFRAASRASASIPLGLICYIQPFRASYGLMPRQKAILVRAAENALVLAGKVSDVNMLSEVVAHAGSLRLKTRDYIHASSAALQSGEARCNVKVLPACPAVCRF